MPLTLPNTTLNLSTVDQIKAVYEYVVAELGLAEAPNPFTNGLLRQSDQDIAKFIHEVISANLVSVGCSTLPSFSIPDYDNDALVKVLIDQLNYSIAACNLGGGSTSLLLIPTGATESVDGEYQLFTWDGESVISDPSNGWQAEVDVADKANGYTVQLKMPVLVDDNPSISVVIGNISSYDALYDYSDGKRIFLEAVYITDNLAAELRLYSKTVVDETPTINSFTTVAAPAAGTVITLIVDSETATMSWASESHPISLSEGFLPQPSDLSVFSVSTETPPPLSIKVSATS